MPIYEYKCINCGNVYECFIKHNDDKQIKCPECGSTNKKKILSVTSPIYSENHRPHGKTCCGREERCDSPPCGGGGRCRRTN